MKYEDLNNQIISSVGGRVNIEGVAHCITRLRFTLKDGRKFNEEKLKGLKGVLGTAVANNQYQVIIGNQVEEVYKELIKILGIASTISATNDEKASFSPKEIINTIAGLFTPLVPALAGSGIIKGILVLLANFGLLANTTGTYQILNAAADAVFYFMPLVLAFSCATKFKTNVIVAMAIGGSLVYPNLVTFMTEAESVSFLGLPVIVTNYASTVIPIILSIYVYSQLEKLLNRFIPKILDLVVTPALSLVIMVPATILVFGPFGNYTSNLLAQLFVSVTGFSPLIAGAIFGGAYPIFVMFGVHRALVPIGINEVTTLGSTSLWAFTGPSNFAQAGAALGVSFRIKDKEMKSVAISSAISALFGITEPALYGVNLKYKKPMIAVVAAGAVGGAIAGLGGAKAYAVAIPSLLTIPAFIGNGFVAFLIAIAISFVVGLIIAIVLGVEEGQSDNSKVEETENKHVASTLVKASIVSPLDGKVAPIEQGSDQAFASKAMGEGVVIQPSSNNLYAPVNGQVTALFPSQHAIGLTTDNGIELLVHIGVDTVELDGKYFQSLVKQGDNVEEGQELIRFDRDTIEAAGYLTETYLVVINTKDFLEVVFPEQAEQVTVGQKILTVI